MRKTFLLITIILFSISVYGQSGPGPSPQTASGVVRYSSPPFTCDSTKKGRVYFNTSGNTLNWCDGTAWRSALSTAMGITGSGTTGQLAKWTSSSAIGNATAGTDYENPLTFSSPLVRTVNAISIPAATSSVNGYLSSTDWSTFNNKQATITFGTGVQTALGVNIGSAGAPILFNGAGGTPSSLALANATGLPISTGVSGLGTGVATALAVNVGSAGAFVVNGGALGTPASGILTNATGLPAVGGGTGQSTYTKGDVLASPGSNTLNKLGVGTDGQVLTADAASTNGVKWAAASATSKSILGVNGGNAALALAGGTVFTAPFDPDLSIGSPVADEGAVSFVAPYAGTVKNLFLRSHQAATGGTTITVTVRKNGVNTTITASLSAVGDTNSSDTTHTASFSQGDVITFSLTPVGGVTSAGIASISIEYDSP